ncbi:hypothetical protein SGRA_3524 [Saprospira grandis str. Lewin]|uniref:Uncharacterized protein n=1 Tax=Saprospira grandis (strain Lewin) TaxID=984262 RepID=H6L084_SAPGL|nr:hypothetical protein SGRA_3524 [Saprospira grandis str. Lewin]
MAILAVFLYKNKASSVQHVSNAAKIENQLWLTKKARLKVFLSFSVTYGKDAPLYFAFWESYSNLLFYLATNYTIY